MIYEYAIDPSLVSQWHDRKAYLFFDEKFGIITRRIVSIYPKKTKWQRMIWDAFQSSEHAGDENAKLRLGALIGKLTEEAVKRRSTFSEIPTWLERAEREHSDRPFRAILTSITGRSNPDVIDVGKLIEYGHEKWTVPDLPMTPRRASEVAVLIAPVLRTCKHAIFVDPYFDPVKARYKRPFKAMIEKLFEWRDGSEELTIELHTGIERFFKSPSSPIRTVDNEQLKYNELVASCRDKLPEIVPRDIKIRLVIWKERYNGQELHNRYVLTDVAGIFLGTGLDECSNPDSESMDNITLLPKEQRNTCWKHYERTSPAFNYAGDPVEIIGQL